MSYRDDLEAAHARIAELEAEVKRLGGKVPGDSREDGLGEGVGHDQQGLYGKVLALVQQGIAAGGEGWDTKDSSERIRRNLLHGPSGLGLGRTLFTRNVILFEIAGRLSRDVSWGAKGTKELRLALAKLEKVVHVRYRREMEERYDLVATEFTDKVDKAL